MEMTLDELLAKHVGTEEPDLREKPYKSEVVDRNKMMWVRSSSGNERPKDP